MSDSYDSGSVIRNYLQSRQNKRLCWDLHKVSPSQHPFNWVYTHWDLHMTGKVSHFSSVLLWWSTNFPWDMGSVSFCQNSIFDCIIGTKTQKSSAVYDQCLITARDHFGFWRALAAGISKKRHLNLSSKVTIDGLTRRKFLWLSYHSYILGTQNILSKRVNKMVNFMLCIFLP